VKRKTNQKPLPSSQHHTIPKPKRRKRLGAIGLLKLASGCLAPISVPKRHRLPFKRGDSPGGEQKPKVTVRMTKKGVLIDPTLMRNPLLSVLVGDTVLRWFGGMGAPMRLRVTAVTEDRIICGPWEFHRATGAEIDDLLGWGPASATGSIIRGVSADPGGTEE
jgi:hypothetical protein